MKLMKQYIAIACASICLTTQTFGALIQVEDTKKPLPLRAICNKLGYEVGWSQEDKQITIALPDKEVKFALPDLVTSGEALMKEDTTYVTAGWLERMLGIEVQGMTLKDRALHIVELLVTNKYQDIIAAMDDVSQKMIDVTLLKQAWEPVYTLYGELMSYDVDTVETLADGSKQVCIKMVFDKANIKLTLVFNTDYEVTGLRFDLYTYAQALPTTAIEKQMTIASNGQNLPAILTLPGDKGQYPVVVLVHGSGPNDKDETIGGVKVFRDIAYALAEQGIATLRYDKRTYVNQAVYMMDPTLYDYEEEVIQDAVAAIEMMGVTAQIDHDNVYVLGHSLGGMSVPMIASQVDNVAGYVMMASPARHLADVVYEQMDYLTTVQGLTGVQKEAYMDAVALQVEATKAMTPANQPGGVGLAGITNEIWATFNTYPHVEMAKEIEVPMLVVQGGRDYQVTMEDYALWSEALEEDADVTFKAYEDLNHLMVSGEGKSVPDEYYRADAVSEEFLEDLGAWILEVAEVEATEDREKEAE